MAALPVRAATGAAAAGRATCGVPARLVLACCGCAVGAVACCAPAAVLAAVPRAVGLARSARAVGRAGPTAGCSGRAAPMAGGAAGLRRWLGARAADDWQRGRGACGQPAALAHAARLGSPHRRTCWRGPARSPSLARCGRSAGRVYCRSGRSPSLPPRQPGVRCQAAVRGRRCVPGPRGAPGVPAARAGRSGPGTAWPRDAPPDRGGPLAPDLRPGRRAARLSGARSGQRQSARLEQVWRREPEAAMPSGPAGPGPDCRSVPGPAGLASDRGQVRYCAGPETVAAAPSALGAAGCPGDAPGPGRKPGARHPGLDAGAQKGAPRRGHARRHRAQCRTHRRVRRTSKRYRP